MVSVELERSAGQRERVGNAAGRPSRGKSSPAPAPGLIEAAQHLLDAFLAWRTRARTSNALARLDDDQLRNIGLVRTPVGYDRSP